MSRFLTPPQIAERLGVEAERVRKWCASGELVAVNLAEGPKGRPRYKVDEAELEAFLFRRQPRPAPQAKRRQRPVGVIEFY